MKTQLRIIACGFALVLSGCAAIGPKVARQAQYPYNEAIVHSQKEQLLLNIVRMRYRDNPFFLEVGSVTTSHTLGMSLNGTVSFPGLSNQNKHSTGAVLNYNEQPTITYVPLKGEAYVKQLLKPIPLLRTIDLIESGWSIERVFNICVQCINKLENAPSAAGPTPTYVPQFESFAKLASNLRVLQRANLINLGKDPSYDPTDVRALVDPGASILMQIEDDANFQPIIDDVYTTLQVNPELNTFELTGNFLKPYSDSKVKIKTRTLLGALFYVSQAVDVPSEHLCDGLVTITRYSDGTEFNWDTISGRELKILSSKSNPKCASVKVYYRGYWFYVADNDLNSKSSFMLLSKLFNLQYLSEGSTVAVPQLTIPLRS